MHRINFRNNKIGLKRAFIKCLWVLYLQVIDSEMTIRLAFGKIVYIAMRSQTCAWQTKFGSDYLDLFIVT